MRASSRTVDGERIQGTGRRAEMLARQVQIDGRLFEVTMAEQHLDGAQVGASLQQMRGEAVPKCVRMNMAICETGAFGACDTFQIILVGDRRSTPRVPRVARKHGRLAAESAPVLAQAHRAAWR